MDEYSLVVCFKDSTIQKTKGVCPKLYEQVHTLLRSAEVRKMQLRDRNNVLVNGWVQLPEEAGIWYEY